MTEMVSLWVLVRYKCHDSAYDCGVVDCDEWPREVLSILSLALSEPWGFHVV